MTQVSITAPHGVSGVIFVLKNNIILKAIFFSRFIFLRFVDYRFLLNKVFHSNVN